MYGREVPVVESGWDEHCSDKQITSRGCAQKGEYTYMKLYSKFVRDNFGEVYKTSDAFFELKGLISDLNLDAKKSRVPSTH